MWTKIVDTPLLRAIVVYGLIVLTALIFSWILQPVLFPLAVACILYVMLNPIIVNLEGRGINSSISISLVLILLFALTIGSVMVLIPLLVDQVQQLQDRLPLLWEKTKIYTEPLITYIQNNLGLNLNPDSVIQRSLEGAEKTGASLVLSSAGTMMQLVMAIFLVPLITFFLLRDFHNIRNKMMSWLPNRAFELGWLIYHGVARQLQEYFRGVMMQSTIIAIFSGIGFYLLNVEMAFLFGVSTGLFNLIPYIGPPLAMIAPLIVSLTAESIEPITLVGIPAVILAAQLLDNFLIVPTLIANTVNLHPLLVLLGIIVFGAFFGFIGMLIAIPVMAISKIIFTSLMYGLNVRQTV